MIANLKIEASGYTPNPYTVVEPLQQLSNSDGDQLLESVTAPAPATPAEAPGASNGSAAKPPAGAVYAPTPQKKLHFVLPAYVRRQDIVKLAKH